MKMKHAHLKNCSNRNIERLLLILNKTTDQLQIDQREMIGINEIK